MRQKLLRELASVAGTDHVRENEPMRLHTTFRIGGPADLFITLKDPRKAGPVMELLRGCGGFMEYYVQRRGNEAAFAYSVMSGCLILVILLTLLIRFLGEKKASLSENAE